MHEESMTKWHFRDFSMVILTIICLLLAANIILVLIDAESLLSNFPQQGLITIALFLLQEFIFLAPLYFLAIKKYGLKMHDLGFRKIKIRTTIVWIFKGMMIVFLANIIFALFTSRLNEDIPGFSPQEQHLPLFGTSTIDITAAVIALIFIAPIVEEVLFRGFILQTLMAKFKPAIASVISAAIFALVHFEFQSVGIIFFLALVINWIFMRSKSLWPCIGFHMLNNALVFLAEILLY